MPEHKMGGAFYYSYMPNVANPTASFSFYLVKGIGNEPNAPLYHFSTQIPIPESDWDDLKIGDVAHYKRVDALRRWHISIHDGKRMDAEIDADFFAGAWHYIDNTFETPKYLAGDRYHRPWKATGTMVLDGTRYDLNHTGDADHSWGPRVWEPLYKSKYMAGQCGTDFAFHAFSGVALDGGVFPYGFIWDGKKMSPISGLEVTPRYGRNGVQEGVVMNIIDSETRLTRVEGTSFCAHMTDHGSVWNNDCYADFTINDGQYTGSGILSYYWNRDYYRNVFGR
ncbi:MAG: hypothetical protein ACKVT1_11055 [Dehalococcoidia bacterium]